MELEKQVCTLEQAKRLKELGVKQDGLFQWCDFIKDYGGTGPYIWKGERLKESQSGNLKVFAAFTVAELGEMLPYRSILSTQERDMWLCGYYESEIKFSMQSPKRHKHSTLGETEAQARAAMLIYLLENNLIK